MSLRRVFTILLTGMSMLTVALFSGFLAMRLAIHGREVKVPNLTGMSLAEANEKTSALGLALHLDNRFYSTMTPSGRIISQFPLPGATVRKAWDIRVTESLGAQQVSIPDVVGQAERPASLAIRRLSLDLGAVATIGAPGEPGIVLAQSPPPNAEGVDRPRVSLLLSQPGATVPQAYLMPQLTGLPFSAAASRARLLGLQLVAIADPNAPPPAAVPPTPPPGVPGTGQSTAPAASGGASEGGLAGVVTGQSPLSGHRVLRGESVRVILSAR